MAKEVVFTVNLDTGETELTINGIAGKGCEVIHKLVSEDLKSVLGIEEMSVQATPEKAKPARYTTVGTNTVRR